MRNKVAAFLAAGLLCAGGPSPTLAATKAEAKPSKARSEKAKSEAAPDPRVWSVVRTDDNNSYALRFALPRATDPAFAATCQPSAQLLQIAVEAPSDNKVRSGDGVPLSLSNGKRRLELAATAFLGASDGVLVVEAAVTLDPRVLDLFRDGETLTIKMSGTTQTLPLAGARARLGDFERACLSRR